MNDADLSEKKFFSYATVATMCNESYIAVKTFLETFYRIGPPEVLYTYDPLVEELATEAAKLIHADPDEITYIKNTTEGINIAVDALPLNPGDEVLVQAQEYPANLLPWLRKKQDGATITIIRGENSPASFQKLIESISPRTKAIAISSAQYYDGYIADISQLSALCIEKDIFLVLDAVQTIGIRAFDTQATPIDILVTGGQKYLRAGVGTGFLYVNKRTLPKLKHTKVGIRSMETFTEDTYTLKPTTGRFQDGTQNLYGIVALHAALQRVNCIGVETIEQKSQELLRSIKARLSADTIPFLDYGDQQGNIVSIPVSDPPGIYEFLKKKNIYIRTIKDVARISFVHDTKEEDIKVLIDAIGTWYKGH